MKTDSTADKETRNAQKISETLDTAAHICNTSIGKLRQEDQDFKASQAT